MPRLDDILNSLEEVLEEFYPNELILGWDDGKFSAEYDPISDKKLDDARKKLERLLTETDIYINSKRISKKNREIGQLIYDNILTRITVIDTKIIGISNKYEGCFPQIGYIGYGQVQEFRLQIEANGKDLTKVADIYLSYLKNFPSLVNEYIENNSPIVRHGIDEDLAYVKELLSGINNSLDKDGNLVKFSFNGLYRLLLDKGAISNKESKKFKKALDKAKDSLRGYRDFVNKNKKNYIDKWVIGTSQFQKLLEDLGCESSIAELANEAKYEINSRLTELENILYEIRPKLKKGHEKKSVQERWKSVKLTLDEIVKNDKISFCNTEKRRSSEVIDYYQEKSNEFFNKLKTKLIDAGEEELVKIIENLKITYRPIPKEQRGYSDVYMMKGVMKKGVFGCEVFVDPFDSVMNCKESVYDTVFHEGTHCITNYIDYLTAKDKIKGKKLKRLLFDMIKDEGMTTNMEQIAPELIKEMSAKSRIYTVWAGLRIYSRALADIATMTGNPELLQDLDAIPVDVKRKDENYQHNLAYSKAADIYGFFEQMGRQRSLSDLAAYAANLQYTAITYFLGKRALKSKFWDGRILNILEIAREFRKGSMPV